MRYNSKSSIDAAVCAAISKHSTLSRRTMLGLGGATALSIGTMSLWPTAAAGSGSLEPAVSTLATIARDMFPHRDVPESVFIKFAAAQLGVADEASRKMLRNGIQELDQRAGGSYRDLDGVARVKLLASFGGTPFFNTVRFSALVALYSDPVVVGLFGYEGPSLEKGGYLTRGYDDLRWLPDPD